MAKYFTLVVREPGGEWSPEFGDYRRKVVAEQMACDKANIGYGYGWVKGTKLKIIATDVAQDAVDAAVAKLNAKEDA